MNVYKAQEMYKLAYSQQPFEKEKEKVMNKIHEAATRGEFQTRIFKDALTDYQLMIAWLNDLGYKCICYSDIESDRIYVKWER